MVDDHTLSREGLRLLLAQEPAISVVGAADGNQAISIAEALQSDIVLLAVNIQELSALNALSLIRKKSPRTNVLILSGCPDDELMSAAL